METPSSTTRRVTRSQAISAITNPLSLSSSKESEKSQSKSIQRNQDRSALFDITNDSPIVGLAIETPSSGKRNMSRIKNSPGTGEALLRGQVKNLLQKVEEEAEQITKISMESRPFIHLVSSPMGLLAPTPANTPQVVDFGKEEVKIVITAPVVAGQCNIFEEEEKSPSVTRSLMLDFSSDCSSVVTQNTEDDNDNSSVWSMQVNASSKDEEDYDEEDQVFSYNEEEEYYEEEEEIVDGLCEGMKKMSVEGAELAGKHVRFVYDSEDEEIFEAKEEGYQGGGVLRLKGFPTPKGKHVRFAADDE